jgi:heterodisulfide reductase subunit C
MFPSVTVIVKICPSAKRMTYSAKKMFFSVKIERLDITISDSVLDECLVGAF